MSDSRLDTVGWILLVLGLSLIGNALWMLAGPMHWYTELPAAVPDTGPFNPHFVRDIGCAFLTAGFALVWSARTIEFRYPLAATAWVFLGAHSTLHIYDTLVGNLPSSHWSLDFAGVYLPTIVLGVLVVRMRTRLDPHVEREA